MEDFIINFADENEKKALWRFLEGCEGRWRFEVCRCRPRRTDAQNRYYHAVIVKHLSDFLRDQGDFKNAEIAHEILKTVHLQVPITTKDGEVICYATGSTAKLTTTEFIEYNERCIAWLAEMFHIVVPDPGQYYSKDADVSRSHNPV